MTIRLEPLTGNREVTLKFGRNTDIDTAAEEDIWDGGGDYTPPTAARVHDLASTSTDDAAAGTGARTVEVYGLDSDYAEQSETVTLNGISNVATVNSYLRLHRMVVRSAGSGGENAGAITATAQTDSTVSAQISIGNNQTLMAFYTVPFNRISHIYQYYAYLNKGGGGGAADVSLLVRPLGEVWQIKHVASVDASGTGGMRHEFIFPLAVPAKADIKIKAAVSANNSDVAAGFDLVNVEPYS